MGRPLATTNRYHQRKWMDQPPPLNMKKKTNRRSFIKSVAMTSGAIAVASSLKQLSWAKPTTRRFSFYDEAARRLLARMTLAEKIGQMTQGEQNSMREGDIEKYSLGSLLCGGSSD